MTEEKKIVTFIYNDDVARIAMGRSFFYIH